MKRLRINVDRDSMGCMELTPVSDKIRNKIRYYLRSMNVNNHGTAYIQNDSEQEQFMHDHMPVSKAQDLERGWRQCVMIDAWTFLHFFGWDAHLLAETGELWK